MGDNPFKELVDIYNASVEKADRAGFAAVYKQATDIVFNNLKEELTQLYKLNITITDVEYLDGYCLFGMGTNSIVHFHIKETPGWKYGIWWSPVAKQDYTEENPIYENDRLRCNLFTQYEEEIDKFKPSASMIAEELTIHLDETLKDSIWRFARDIKFIHDEPYLAFYREMHYSDFNREHISRAEAKSYFKRYFKKKKLEKKVCFLNDLEMLSTIYTILKDDIDTGDCFIQDCGSNYSPRYKIIFKNTCGIQDGHYVFFELFIEDVAKEMEKLFNKKLSECKKRTNKAKFTWYNCCEVTALVLSADRFKEYFESAVKVDFKKLAE